MVFGIFGLRCSKCGRELFSTCWPPLRWLARRTLGLLVVTLLATALFGRAGSATAQTTVSDIRPVQGEQGGTLYLHGTGLDGLSTGDVTVGGTQINGFTNTITSTLQPNYRGVEIPSSGEGPVSVTVAGQTAAKRFTIVTGGPATFPSQSVFYSDEDGTSSPQAVARGDINGDGHLDLVVGFAESGSVVWFENNGAGSFGEGQTIAEDVNYPRDLVLADITDDTSAVNAQDGALDVIVATGQGASGGSSDDRIFAFVNERTGTEDVSFRSKTIVDSSPVDNVWDLAAGDIDADGDVDILSVSRDNDALVRHENVDNDSTFSNQSLTTFDNGDPRSVVIANLDSGDDYLDVLVADYGNNNVHRLSGDGTGAFALDTSYSAAQPVDLSAGDFDNDGLPGVAVATEGDGAPALALVNNTVSGISRTQVSGTTGIVRSVHVADVSGGDGTPEVIVGHASTGDVTVHTYSGSFGSGTTAAIVSGTPTEIATADVDANGDLDPIVVTQDQDQGIVIPNGSGAPQISSFPGDQTIQEDQQLGPLSFSIGDADDADSTLTVTGTSSDQSVVPDSNVAIGGSESERSVTVTPLPDSNGTATITVDVSDGTNTTSNSFLLTVDPVNDPPVVETNKTLLVGKQTTTTIADSVLRVTDVEDVPSAINYTIDSAPVNGTLLLNGEPVTAGFTQADVNDGLLTYTHESADGLTDSFSFTATDQGGTGLSTSATFDIAVKVFELVAAQDTADAGFVRVGQGDSLDVRFRNNGNVPLTNLQAQIATLQELPPGAASAPDDYSTGLDSIASLSPGETARFAVGFDPSEAGLRAAAVRVVADSGQASIPIVGRGIGLSTKAGTAERGESASVTVTVQGGYRPNRDTLFVRPGGTAKYRAIPLQPTSGSEDPVELDAEIPPSLVTTSGVDYYVGLGAAPDDGASSRFVVTDPAGGVGRAAARPKHQPVSFDQLSAPLTFSPEAYRMVSIPAVPEGGAKAALQQAYGDYQPNQWRVERWDADEGSYHRFPEVDSLRPGQAFWLVTSGGKSLRLSSGRTVEANAPVRLPLDAGWNQIGSPFGFSVPWDTVLAASGLGPADIDGPIAYGDSAYRTGQSELDPWRGYFVFSAEADTLVVPPTGGDSTDIDTSSQSSALAKAKTRESGYRLTVEALSPTGRSATVLGLQSGAVVGRDRYDRAQAPPIGGGPRIGALEPVGKRAVAHAYSARPPGTGGSSGQSWTLRLRRPESDSEVRPVKLRVSGTGQMPEQWGRYLLDLKREKRITSGASLDLDAGESRRVKVILGTRAYAETASESISLSSLETGLRGSYPNPFEEQATIEYVISDEQEVVIEVYNVLGQRVRTLVDGRKKQGMHNVEWEGENRYGTPVGSGVYFYHLRAGETSETRKMVFVR